MLERIHFQIMDALHRNESLTKAAEELHLSQSALSHSIKKLEKLLNVTLWKKNGRKLHLSAAGEYLLKAAQRLEPQYKEIERSLIAYGKGKRGMLRIGVECHPCYDFLLLPIQSFLAKWNDVDVEVTRNFRFDGYTALRDHHVDVLISPDYLEYSGLEYHPVLDFELMLAVAPEHWLASRSFVSPADLQNEILFSYPIERERLDVFVNFLLPAGSTVREHIPVENTEIMLQLVASGRGVSTFPDWIIQKHAAHYSVKGIQLGETGIHKHLYFVVRSDTAKGDYLDDFISMAYETSV